MKDHPLRGRLNAWFLDAADEYVHRTYGDVKARLLGGAPSVVLELGPGTGANFRYYRRGTRVIAVEPNARMHDRLRRRAARFGLDLEIHATGAEHLDLAAQSVDFACATLVLCTVADPAAVVAEVRRVLRPGGRFVVIEHVMAPAGSAVARLQRILRRPWRWLAEGCDLCNRTPSVLEHAGFRQVAIEPLRLPTLLLPIRDQIVASCTR